MDVLAVGERLQQALVARHVRHDPELDLGVIGRDDAPAIRRDEGLAYAPAFLGADRNVLQVRIGGRQSPGGGRGLVVMGMNPPGVFADFFGQAVGVGALELRKPAMFQDQRRQRVLGGQLLQHVLGRRRLALGRLAHHRNLEPLEENFLQLLGRAQVELAAGRFPGALFESLELFGDLGALDRELVAVDQHAARLHAGQHVDQRDFQLFVDFLHARVLADFRPQLAVQRQADLGVFAGIVRGLGHRHLVEGQLLLAFPGDLFVGRGLAPQVTRGQRIQVVARGGGVVAVGLEHRVVANAGELQPGAAQHVQVVLGVLRKLRAIGIGQHAGQRGDRLVSAEFVVLVGVPDRHVERLAGFDRERESDQIGIQRLEAGGFGIECNQLGGFQHLDQLFERLAGSDRLDLQLGALGLTPRLGVGVADLAQPGREAEALEQFDQPIGIRAAGGEVFDPEVQRHVFLERDQFARQWQLIERISKIFADLAADLVGMLDHRIEAAVLVQPLGRGLGPDLLDAGDVVRGVAGQRQQVADELGPDAELVDHRVRVVAFFLHAVLEHHAVPDQLGQVLVARRDQHRQLLVLSAARERGNHVVGLDPVHTHPPDAERIDQFVQRRQLGAQVVGHGRAVGLVVGERIVAEVLARRVEDHGQVIGPMLFDQAADHVGHAEYRARGQPLAAGQAGKRVKCAVQVGRSVDQAELFRLGVVHARMRS